MIIQGAVMVAWTTCWEVGRARVCLEGRADRGEETGGAVMAKRKPAGDHQTPSLGCEGRLGPLSLACPRTCWFKTVGSRVMPRARILDWHSPRECLSPTSHLRPCHVTTHVDILLVTPAIEAARPLPTTKQHGALECSSLSPAALSSVPSAPNHSHQGMMITSQIHQLTPAPPPLLSGRVFLCLLTVTLRPSEQVLGRGLNPPQP